MTQVDFSEGIKGIVKAATPHTCSQVAWSLVGNVNVGGSEHRVEASGMVTASEHSQSFAMKFPMEDAMIVAASRCGATRKALLAVLAMGPAAVQAAAAAVAPEVRTAIEAARDAGVATTTTNVRRVRVTIK